LQTGDPLAVAIQEANRTRMLVQTLRGQWVPAVDGRIHPVYKPLGARSSRWSSSTPNMQNVAKRGDAVQMRRAFIPAPGNVFVQADLSQIEYRVAAAYSQDDAMLAAFTAGEDLHMVAARVLSGAAEPTKTDRAIAKGIGFGKLYGQQPAQTAKAAGVPLDVMMDRIRAYDTAFPRLAAWCREVQEETERRGLWTPPNLYGRPYKVAAAYQGVNYLCQSAAREVFADWLLLVDEEFRGCVVAAIHDELLLEVPEDRAGDARRFLIDSAGWAGQRMRGVPVVAEAAGPLATWLEAYE
jgi:DNA polymerase-1